MPVEAADSPPCPQVLSLGESPSQGDAVRLAILDRDGTINVDAGYSHDPSALVLTPWIAEAAVLLQERGFTLTVASNQSAVARGFFGNEDVAAFNTAVAAALAPLGIHIAQFAWCPHGPDDGCPNRKPGPGMIRWLVDAWGPSEVIFIGDSASDEEAAAGAGVTFLHADPSLTERIRVSVP